MVELSTKSGSPHPQWLGPPLIKKASVPKTFSFDIRPDCQYWLSMRSFNPKYAQLYPEHVFVLREQITCPYFTIEFKKDDGSTLKAENQVATAAVALLAGVSSNKIAYSRLGNGGIRSTILVSVIMDSHLQALNTSSGVSDLDTTPTNRQFRRRSGNGLDVR